MNIPYPSNYFDPFGDEPQSCECLECGNSISVQDATPINKLDYNDGLVCDECNDEN